VGGDSGAGSLVGVPTESNITTSVIMVTSATLTVMMSSLVVRKMISYRCID